MSNQAKTGSLLRPKVEVIYRDPSGAILRKFLPWRRPSTDAALAEYIENYLELVSGGYKPDGDFTPVPHCARVHFLGKVLAEWKRNLSPGFSAESELSMAADERPGRGGIPAAVPCTPASGVGSSGRRVPHGIHPVNISIPQSQRVVENAPLDGDFGAESGHEL